MDQYGFTGSCYGWGRGGFTQANHGSPHNLKKMKRGDWLVFYLPKTKFKEGEPLQSFTAIGRITDDEPFQFEMSPDFKPYRRKVSFFECHQTSIRPLLDDLAFIPDKKKWGFPFRRGLFSIDKNDFVRIANTMDVELDF